MVKKKKKSGGIDRFAGGMGSIDPSRNNNKKIIKPDDIVDMVKLVNEYQSYRLVGRPWGSAQWWITIETQKGEFNICKPVPNYDPEHDTFDESIDDPYAEIPNKKRRSKYYYVNVIDREVQGNEPRRKPEWTKSEKKTRIKEKGSQSWTPFRVLRLTAKLAGDIAKLNKLNKHKVKGKVSSYDIADPKYGCDIFIQYDKDADSASDMYSIQKGDPSPLTKEEMDSLMYDVSKIHQTEPLEDAEKEAENLASKAGDLDDEDEDDDDDAMSRKKTKKKKKSKDEDKPKKKKKSKDDGKSKSGLKKKKKSKDEDEKPKKKKSSLKKKKK